jgi:hypothetical protein
MTQAGKNPKCEVNHIWLHKTPLLTFNTNLILSGSKIILHCLGLLLSPNACRETHNMQQVACVWLAHGQM